MAYPSSTMCWNHSDSRLGWVSRIPQALDEQQEVDTGGRPRRSRDRQPDDLGEAPHEPAPQQCEEQHRQGDRMLWSRRARGFPERVLEEVDGGVGGREGLGDDEVGRREPQQDQDEDFPPQPLTSRSRHGDRPLAVRRGGGDVPVDRTAPKSVTRTRNSVAIEESRPALSKAMDGW